MIPDDSPTRISIGNKSIQSNDGNQKSLKSATKKHENETINIDTHVFPLSNGEQRKKDHNSNHFSIQMQ